MNQKRKRITAIAMLSGILVLFIALITNYYVYVSRERDKEIASQLSEVYGQVNNQFNAFTRKNWNFLTDCAMAFKLIDDSVRIDTFIKDMKEMWNFDNLLFINEKGDWVDSIGNSGFIDLGGDLSRLNFAKEKITTDVTLDNGKSMMICAIPVEKDIYDDFSFTALAVTYDQNSLLDVMDKPAYEGNARCYLVYPDGKILLSMQDPSTNSKNIFDYMEKAVMSDKQRQQLKDDLSSRGSGTIEYTLDGVQKYMYYQPVGIQDWMMVGVVQQDAVGQYSARIVNRTAFMTITCFTLLAVGIIMLMYLRSRETLRRKDDELSYRNELFEIMSQNSNNIFLVLKPGALAAEYVSSNIERVLGLSPDDLSKNAITASLKVQDNSYTKAGIDISKNLIAGQNNCFSVVRKNSKTGRKMWFDDYVYHVKIGDIERYIFMMFDRTDEHNSREQLKDALEIAKVANESKSAFLSNMSHDIRTPMNVIIGFLPLLERDADNPIRVKEYKRKIENAGQHLMTLINDVLDMSKIESGKSSVNLVSCRTSEEIEKITSIIRLQTQAKHQNFKVIVQDVTCEYVQCDPAKINRVLINILTNAVKYTPENGNIVFTIKQLPSRNPSICRLRFIVQDDGIGMAEEFQEKIFDTFAREDDEAGFDVRGSGLGMAIVKSLVELMGGSITVSSEKGKGSVFIVELSLKVDHEVSYAAFWKEQGIERSLIVDDESDMCESVTATAASGGLAMDSAYSGAEALETIKSAYDNKQPYQLVIINCCIKGGMDGIETVRHIKEMLPPDKLPLLLLTAYDRSRGETCSKEAGADGYIIKPFFLPVLKDTIQHISDNHTDEAAPAAEKPKFSDFHVLIAEDYEINAEVLKATLEMFGVTAEVCENGKLALERMEKATADEFQLILMDIQMPQMNGVEATRAIRNCSNTAVRNIPIYAMSANAFSEDMQKAYDAGMDGYLTKPINLDALEKTLTEISRKNSAEQS